MLINIAMSWAETIHRYSSSLSRKTRALKFALCIISTCASILHQLLPSIYSLAFSTGKRGRSGERREDNFVSEGTSCWKLLYQWTTSWASKNSESDGSHLPDSDETSDAMRPSEVYVSGPCGGAGGSERDMGVGPGTRILKVMLRHGLAVDAIRIMYQHDGCNGWTGWWGGSGGQLSEINLDVDDDEYLTWITGRYGFFGGEMVIRSLTFGSNKKTYGPYGVEEGFAFDLDAGGQRIVGFFARSGQFLDAIGVYTA